MGINIPNYLAVIFTLMTFLFMFDFFKKLMKWLGFRVYDFSGGEDCDVITEGKNIALEEEAMFYDELKEKNEMRARSRTEKTESDLAKRLITS